MIGLISCSYPVQPYSCKLDRALKNQQSEQARVGCCKRRKGGRRRKSLAGAIRIVPIRIVPIRVEG